VRVFVPESFDRSTVLLARPDQVTVVAAGTDAARNALAHASQPRAAAVSRVTHAVKAGENLGSIARRYKVTVAALRAENGMPDSVVLSPGDTVWVPVAEAPRARGAAKTRAAKRETRGPDSSERPAKSESRRARRTHKVARGDTLLRVAGKYKVSVDDLARRNGMKPDSVLRLGAMLNIP
jgi:LysM repeat protein